MLKLGIVVTFGSFVEDLVVLGGLTLRISSFRHLQLARRNALLSKTPCIESNSIRKSYQTDPTGAYDPMSFRWSIRVQLLLYWDHKTPDKLASVRLFFVSVPRITSQHPGM